MPPYKKPTSQKQARKFWMLAKEGKMSMEDAKAKLAGVDIKHLPKRVKKKKRK